jgi:hypothetical protein
MTRCDLDLPSEQQQQQQSHTYKHPRNPAAHHTRSKLAIWYTRRPRTPYLTVTSICCCTVTATATCIYFRVGVMPAANSWLEAHALAPVRTCSRHAQQPTPPVFMPITHRHCFSHGLTLTLAPRRGERTALSRIIGRVATCALACPL